MGKTSIEWCDRSINPIRARNNATGAVGHYCEMCAQGCTNCYSSAFQPRFGLPTFGGGQHRDKVTPFLDESRFAEVLRRRKPTKWFWADMTDMFGDWVPDEWIDKCLAVMARTPHHTHQVLTKRPERAYEYFRRWPNGMGRGHHIALHMNNGPTVEFPIPNLWLGTSVSEQKTADENIPWLLKSRGFAAVLFVSYEPALGPVHFIKHSLCDDCETDLPLESGYGGTYDRLPEVCDGSCPKIDWIIVGAESGPKARPFETDWAYTVIEECRLAKMACFIKQLGPHPHWNPSEFHETVEEKHLRLKHPKGGDPSEWPEGLNVRQFPQTETAVLA